MTNILHQVWHNGKRNLDAYFKNWIWSGFIFCAYSYSSDSFQWKISWYDSDKYLDISWVDLQFYASKETKWWHAETYDFHPYNHQTWTTDVIEIEALKKWIEYQESMWFRKIIIPMIYSGKTITQLLWQIITANSYLKNNKKEWFEYYMTLVFWWREWVTILDEEFVESVLIKATAMDITFDWYYVVCDTRHDYKRKVSDNPIYYLNISRVFKVLKKQWFKTIYWYSNFDFLPIIACTEIDYITIWSYDSQRKFSISRYDKVEWWWPSKWRYFSEKLLNFIKSQKLIEFQTKWIIKMIANESNAYSDNILDKNYPRNVHKSDVHKNYFISINNLLNKLLEYNTWMDRIEFLESQISQALNLYRELYDKYSIILDYENWPEHLTAWRTLLLEEKNQINDS